MTKTTINPESAKSKGLSILEYILLTLCLSVMAIRTTFTESPGTQIAPQLINLDNTVYSLTMSALLISAFVIWFVWSLCSRRFCYRFSAIEIGLVIFCIACAVAIFVASNKRAAITDCVVLLAPIFMAVLLVQILDSASKVKLALVVIAALGVILAYQCLYQIVIENQAWVFRYENEPESILEPLGIQPGSFNHTLLEHRIYSKDVKGFFTTSNSAGSFSMLAAFAAVALLIDKFKNRKKEPRVFLYRLIAAVFVVSALIMTKSKGAILASIIAVIMFSAWLAFREQLNRYRKSILLLCLLLVLLAGSTVVLYGSKHNRLPGGNSMLVRWQYWTASARMYANHPFTGVGAGGFGSFYTRYKAPQAPETVQDPHNFLLRIITQFGPLGLLGFLAMIFIPLWRIIFSPDDKSPSKSKQPKSPSGKFSVFIMIAISAGLLVFRPLVIPMNDADTAGFVIYSIFTLYCVPVIAFAIGFWFLSADDKTSTTTSPDVTIAALFCAVVGFVIHNLIDFAIFEPGVSMTFWTVIAVLIALNHLQNPQRRFAFTPPGYVKLLTLVAAAAIIWSFFHYTYVGPVKATLKTKRAMSDLSKAHNLLEKASEDDQLDPGPLNLNGRLYLQHYSQTAAKYPELLNDATNCFLRAIERDKVDFKNYEKLTDTYNLLAESAKGEVKSKWLNKAYQNALKAVELYPASDRLHIKLAEAAEKSGKIETAKMHYKRAVEIEDAFREQFRIMYPGRNIVSRLGEEKYQKAKQKSNSLRQENTPQL